MELILKYANPQFKLLLLTLLGDGDFYKSRIPYSNITINPQHELEETTLPMSITHFIVYMENLLFFICFESENFVRIGTRKRIKMKMKMKCSSINKLPQFELCCNSCQFG